MKFNGEDFGFNGNDGTNSAAVDESKTNINSGESDITVNGDNADDINKGDQKEKGDDKDQQPSSTGNGEYGDDGDKGNKNGADKGKEESNKDNELVLEVGTQIDIDDSTYTVDKDGNLVDKDGNIFKKADEVAAYIKELQSVDENGDDENAVVDVASIQKAIGIDVVDEKGKPIEFDNTPDGVAAYVKSVIELKQDEFAQAGINKLFQEFPIVSDVLDYYVTNGYSLDGFGEMKDRSGIVIDDTNVAQQEAIIRESFKEFNKRGDVEKYIKYLKDSGSLLDVAKEELEALQQADADVRKQQADEAKKIAAKQEKDFQDYWNGVHEVIKSRTIGDYKIPETIIIEQDGKKIVATPDDFFNYLYQVDDKGNSRYVNALMKETPEEKRNDEILRAFLKFTGKGYNSLVEMAVAQKEVKKLKFASAQRTSKPNVKITTPSKQNSSGIDEIIKAMGF